MKKIFESDWRGEGESAERVHIYEFINEEEYWEFDSLDFNSKCEYCGVQEDNWVMPGALYHKYEFDNSGTYVVMYETAAYNV
jgi:hypothetical protein